MNKIDFKNKGEEGYETSKINANNLNQIQDNAENAINGLKAESIGAFAQKNTLSNISFNDLIDYGSGLFCLMNASDNRPPTSVQTNYHFYVIQIKHNSSNYAFQQAKWFFGGPIYYRVMKDNNWNDWEEI